MSRQSSPIAPAPSARRAAYIATGNNSGFTLVELLVSVFVLVIVILLVSQMMNNAAGIAKAGHTHITADTQARTVFDRMAADFAQMLRRSDVDYYLKGGSDLYNQRHASGHGWGRRRQTGQQCNDQIAFFSQVPGYYPSTGSRSPVSLVAYRINESDPSNVAYLRLERLGKGLLWNGVENPDRQPNSPLYTSPLVFLPLLIADRWPAATDGSAPDPQSDYETIGPGVFRLEYYYLLKNGDVTDIPWDTQIRPNQTSLMAPQKIGLADVEAITVAIAAVDSGSRALIDTADPTALDDLASDMADFKTAPGRGAGGQKNMGDLEASWEASLLADIAAGQTSNGRPLPSEAARTIRIYSKTFLLKTVP